MRPYLKNKTSPCPNSTNQPTNSPTRNGGRGATSMWNTQPGSTSVQVVLMQQFICRSRGRSPLRAQKASPGSVWVSNDHGFSATSKTVKRHPALGHRFSTLLPNYTKTGISVACSPSWPWASLCLPTGGISYPLPVTTTSVTWPKGCILFCSLPFNCICVGF